MADSSHYLVSFENVSASFGGMDISSIVELQLQATANGIPTVTLSVDACNTGGGGRSAASAMSLAAARALLVKCESMRLTSGATLSLSITARAVGKGGGDAQTLSITGWLLTDVAISPMQMGGVVTVSLTFQHPICKAHFGGMVPGLIATPLPFGDLGASNPVEAFISSLAKYGEAVRYEQAAGASSGVIDAMIDKLEQAAQALEASVTWSGGGMPCASHLVGWDDAIAAGISSYAMPSGGTSVLNRFFGCLVPECSLAVGGDYSGPSLNVRPFTPWEDPSQQISDTDIISLSFPQHDPSPISGVRFTTSGADSGYGSSFHCDTAQTGVSPRDVFYVPASELSREFLYGPIHQFEEPGWLVHMKSFIAGPSTSKVTDAGSVQDDNFNCAMSVGRAGSGSGGFIGGGGSASSPELDYSAALLACAKAYYETSLMKDWGFSVTARFIVSSGGKICPGRVLSVVSGGGTVLSGYVTGVSHAISIASKSAHTTITCSHPRFGSNPPGITSGKQNALYE